MRIMHSEQPRSLNDIERFNKFFNAYNERIAPAIKEEMDTLQLTTITRADVLNYRKVDIFTELREIIIRSWKSVYRNKTLIKAKFIHFIVIDLICLALFWKNLNTQAGMLNKAGALFFISVDHFMTGMLSVLAVFPLERPVFLREQGGKMYKVWTYFISKSLVDIPFLISIPMLSSIILYFGMGLVVNAGHFFMFYFILILLMFAATGVGFFVGCLFSHITTAFTFAPALMTPMILFGGFFANNATIPIWIRWFQYLSPIRYCFEGLVTNEFRGSGIPNNPLEYLNLNLGFGICIGILILYSFVIRFIAYLLLNSFVKKVG